MRNSFPMKPVFSTAQDVTTGAAAVYAAKPVGPETWAVQLSSTANTWVTFVDPTAGGAPIASPSQTVANPAVFTTATQAWVAGQAVVIQGTPPGGFTAGPIYYVVAGGLTTTAVELAATPGGTAIQGTSSSACTLQPLSTLTATTGMLVKASDPPIQYGISPGQYIATLQVSATGTLNIIELTH